VEPVPSVAPSGPDDATTAALHERSKLKKALNRFHLIFFFVTTIVILDTIGAVANDGAQAFTWLVFLAVLFFVPFGLLTAELGSAFPQEGGPYIWPRLAFGRLVGGLNTVVYWASNPIWVGGSLTIVAISVFREFFGPLQGAGQYLFGLAFIWLVVLLAILSLRIGKWVPTVGAWARAALLGFFTITVGIYAARYGIHGVRLGAFRPTWSIFIAAVPLLVFNYAGFELPNSAGEEMSNPARDVPAAVAVAAVSTVLLYTVPILAILIVLPTSQVTSLGGFIAAIKTVFVVYGGHITQAGPVLSGAGSVLGDVVAALFIFVLFSGGVVWIIGSDRDLAVAAYDGAGPRLLGRFSKRFGTPVPVNLMSGLLATTVMVMAFLLTNGDAAKYFSAVLAVAISTTLISYISIYPSLIRLRYSHPDVPRPYRIPGRGNAGAWIVGLLTSGWVILAAMALLWPGFGTPHPDASLPAGFAGQRLQYELSQFLPLVFLAVVGVFFYLSGRRTRREVARPPRPVPIAAGDEG
jgi:amino acid transporter